MPRDKYRITLSDGRVVTVEADSPPTPEQVLAALNQPSAAAKPDEGPSLGGFIENIGTSGAKAVSDVVSTLDPRNWPGLVQGIAAQNTQNMQRLVNQAQGKPATPLPEAPLAKKYGSPEAAGRSLYTDPVGTVLDLSPLAGNTPRHLARQALTRTGRVVEGIAPRAVHAAIKPIVAELKTMPGASWTGLAQKGEEITDLMLRNRFTKPKHAANVIRDAETKIQAGVNAPQVTPAGLTPTTPAGQPYSPVLDRNVIPAAIENLARNAEGKLIPLTDPGTVRAAGENLRQGALSQPVTRMRPVPGAAEPVPGGAPHEMRQVMVPRTERALRSNVQPPELLDAVRKQSKWDTQKTYGEFSGAEMQAMKEAELAGRQELGRMVPALKPELRRQHEALTLFPLLDRMALRMANADLVNLPAWVMAAGAGSPVKATLLGALANLMKRKQLQIGYRAQDVGRGLQRGARPVSRRVTPSLRAAALLRQLQDEAPE